jgi:hypothetical protein
MNNRGFNASGRGMPVNPAAEKNIRLHQALREAARAENPSALASTMLLQANTADAAIRAVQVEKQR